jgi:hypothetical protein
MAGNVIASNINGRGGKRPAPFAPSKDAPGLTGTAVRTGHNRTMPRQAVKDGRKLVKDSVQPNSVLDGRA